MKHLILEALLAGSYMSQMPMFVVRGQLSPDALATEVRQAFGSAIPGLTVTDSFLIKALFDDSFKVELLRAQVAILSGLVLLALALIGMYGITRFRIATRQRELAIRICMGADTGSILRLVMREVLSAAVGSLGLALVVWIGWKAFLAQHTFKAAPWSPLVWASAVAVWLLVMVLASIVPGMSILKLRPADVLRAD
ncbi:MAG TPA: FtsX-like permease family protein [Candidatus Angelobacter sp.]|nr:FtsX-like permease family protein [Candidatus Angelobacter sp.]